MIREINGIPVIEIREGKTKIYIPNPKLYTREDGTLEPAWAPVFYNPKMEFSRDVAVAFLTALKKMGISFRLVVDPLSGTGIRGLRYINESGNVSKVIINDINPIAYEFMKFNAKINNLEDRVEVYNIDANMLLYLLAMIRERPDFIDIDPFGSPIPFIDSALHTIKNGGVLAVTATDVAPLSGTRETACRRRYFSRSIKVDFDKELGLRILIASIALRAAAQDLYIEPLLSYYVDHYYRAYLVVKRGARKADEMLNENLGFIVYVTKNLRKYVIKGFPIPDVNELRNIKDEYELIGPLWIGKLCEEKVLKVINENAQYLELNTMHRLTRLIEVLISESKITTPYYYRLDMLCSKLKKSMPKINSVLECLRNKGYEASRTHFDPRGFKTSAEYHDVVECVMMVS